MPAELLAVPSPAPPIPPASRRVPRLWPSRKRLGSAHRTVSADSGISASNTSSGSDSSASDRADASLPSAARQSNGIRQWQLANPFRRPPNASASVATAPPPAPAANASPSTKGGLHRYRARTPQEFRKHLMEHEKARTLQVPGEVPTPKEGDPPPQADAPAPPPEAVRFIPIPMDGSCGFNAIAKGANMALAGSESSGATSSGRPNGTFTAKFTGDKMRLLLRDQVRDNTAFFEEIMEKNPAFKCCVEDVSLEKFASSVMRKGVSGHWLGETYGFIELMVIARALKLRIDVFSYDPRERQLRRYEEIKEGETWLGLLFTGPSTGGHFDLLVKD